MIPEVISLNRRFQVYMPRILLSMCKNAEASSLRNLFLSEKKPVPCQGRLEAPLEQSSRW
jgi:hypothetical protein